MSEPNKGPCTTCRWCKFTNEKHVCEKRLPMTPGRRVDCEEFEREPGSDDEPIKLVR